MNKMILHKHIPIFTLLITIGLCLPSFAGTDSQWMLDLQIGVANAGYNKGMLLTNAGISLREGASLYSFRGLSMGNVALFGHQENIYEVGILYGTITKNTLVSASASAGLGFISGTYGQTIGIPFEMRAVFTPLSFVGISCSLFGDINPARSFWGALAGLQFIFPR